MIKMNVILKRLKRVAKVDANVQQIIDEASNKINNLTSDADVKFYNGNNRMKFILEDFGKNISTIQNLHRDNVQAINKFILDVVDSKLNGLILKYTWRQKKSTPQSDQFLNSEDIENLIKMRQAFVDGLVNAEIPIDEDVKNFKQTVNISSKKQEDDKQETQDNQQKKSKKMKDKQYSDIERRMGWDLLDDDDDVEDEPQKKSQEKQKKSKKMKNKQYSDFEKAMGMDLLDEDDEDEEEHDIDIEDVLDDATNVYEQIDAMSKNDILKDEDVQTKIYQMQDKLNTPIPMDKVTKEWQQLQKYFNEAKDFVESRTGNTQSDSKVNNSEVIRALNQSINNLSSFAALNKKLLLKELKKDDSKKVIETVIKNLQVILDKYC